MDLGSHVPFGYGSGCGRSLAPPMRAAILHLPLRPLLASASGGQGSNDTTRRPYNSEGLPPLPPPQPNQHNVHK